jgi:sec-independent protein translocase protein TatA
MFPLLAFLPTLGWTELIIFAVIVLLLFGSRLPTLMRSLGQSVVEFKKGTRDDENPPPSDRT